MVGRRTSFWEGLFSGAMLVSGRVTVYFAPFADACMKVNQFSARFVRAVFFATKKGGPGIYIYIYIPKSPGTSKSEVLAERTLKGPIAEKLYVNVEFLRPNVGIFLIIMDHEV